MTFDVFCHRILRRRFRRCKDVKRTCNLGNPAQHTAPTREQQEQVLTATKVRNIA